MNQYIVHRVHMAQGVVAVSPHILVSEGLGSCVAVTLYDTRLNIGGMAHIMLPSVSLIKVQKLRSSSSQLFNSELRTPNYKLFMCADTAIDALIKEMLNKGAVRKNIIAKMAGGAKMFSGYGNSQTSIGEKNIIGIKYILECEKIPLIGWDVGGNHGRSLAFYLDSGRVIVKAIGKEDREI